MEAAARYKLIWKEPLQENARPTANRQASKQVAGGAL